MFDQMRKVILLMVAQEKTFDSLILAKLQVLFSFPVYHKIYYRRSGYVCATSTSSFAINGTLISRFSTSERFHYLKTIDDLLPSQSSEFVYTKKFTPKPYRVQHPTSEQYHISFPVQSLKKTIRSFFFKTLLQNRARRLTPYILDSLANYSTLLDLGCGDMILTEYLHQQSDLQVTAIDTVDTNLSNLPVFIYNGATIPFSDCTFDATMVAYVLHHCSDIRTVLSEIKRVTKSRIIIMEEVYKSRFAEKILHLHDSGNRFLSTKMKIPCNFMKVDQWYEIFTELNLKVIKSHRIYQYPTMNFTHQVFFELAV